MAPFLSANGRAESGGAPLRLRVAVQDEADLAAVQEEVGAAVLLARRPHPLAGAGHPVDDGEGDAALARGREGVAAEAGDGDDGRLAPRRGDRGRDDAHVLGVDGEGKEDREEQRPSDHAPSIFEPRAAQDVCRDHPPRRGSRGVLLRYLTTRGGATGSLAPPYRARP